MPRLRDLGLSAGALPTGASNTISDVAGVRVGHSTVVAGDDIRTGVTAIVPHEHNVFLEKVPAAVHTINGFGKAAGFEQVRELGSLETPILLTNTLSVGRAADALIDYLLQAMPNIPSVNPLVGECNDGYLHDLAGRHIEAAHVFQALQQASADVQEGCVGAGTGTACYGWKGGIGSASRRVPAGYSVGVLLQTNFGSAEELHILGAPIGQHLAPPAPNPSDDGSIMMVIATDAPLSARQLGRLARRAPFALGRTGTVCHHGSGDFVIAFSTAYTLHEGTRPLAFLPETGTALNPLFQAVVESIEEAVYNALFMAQTVRGREGHTLHALPVEETLRWLRHYQRGE